MQATIESVSPADLAAELGPLPTVTGAPAAPAAAAPPAAPAGKVGPVVARDSLGRAFDPLYHECSLADGSLVTSADQIHGVDPSTIRPRFRHSRDIEPGTLLARRRNPFSAARLKVHVADPPAEPAAPVNDAPPPATGLVTPPAPVTGSTGAAPAGGASSTGEAPVIADDVAPVDQVAEVASEEDLQAAAALMATTQDMVMRTLLGAGVDQVAGRVEALNAAWLRVFRHYGMEKFGPWAGLALVSGGIVAGAYQHEETRGRLRRAADWCKLKLAGWWVAWKQRRAARAAA